MRMSPPCSVHRWAQKLCWVNLTLKVILVPRRVWVRSFFFSEAPWTIFFLSATLWTNLFFLICTTPPSQTINGRPLTILKADRPLPLNYPHTPTDYRHTDKHLRLVMTLLRWLLHSAGEVGQTDKQTNGRTDGRTDGRTLPSTLSPSLRSR